ncbi:MAG: hypothetical protein ACM3QU_10145 [Verrucomicrobiota bacterium]
MTGFDGTWTVHRTGGLLPPMIGVRKHIDGGRGETRLGPFPGVPFVVDGNSLRYRRPFQGFVDILDQRVGDLVRGRATFRGCDFGRFEMRRTSRDW